MRNPSVSIVVPNFNGRDLLERYLPSVVQEVEAYSGPKETILVDDGSSDGSVAYVRDHYPKVRVVELGGNRGALDAKNAGFLAAQNDLVVCLNNDVELRPGFLPPMVAMFDEPDVFGVGAKVLLMTSGLRDEGIVYGEMRRGRFEVVQPALADASYPHHGVQPILYPHGGACVYDRAKLISLGGYDRLFHPIYWDDLDVGYVAWKRGWRCLYQPRSVAVHQHMATTLRTSGRKRISALLHRNMLLFTWKNITDGPLIRSHLAWLAVRLAAHLARGNVAFLSTLRSALERVPLARDGRRREAALRRRSDAEVLGISRGPAGAAFASEVTPHTNPPKPAAQAPGGRCDT